MFLHARSCSLAAALALVVASTSDVPFPTSGMPFAVTAAMADDNGGDDGGGSGGSDGGVGGRDAWRDWSGSNRGRSLLDLFRGWDRPRSARRKAARRPPQPVLQHEARQLVALGLDAAAITGLETSGFSVDDRATVDLVGAELVRLQIPSGLTLDAARAQVVAAAPGAVVDFNHFYQPDQGNVEPCGREQCLARHVVGWPATPVMPGRCTTPSRIGLIDTAINADHLAFEGGKIETIKLGSGDLPDSGRQHGTAVAALLIGSAASRTPGLVPGSELIAVDAFHRGGGGDRSSAYDLVRAIDLLASRGVEVINMSLTGPANLLLERTVEEAIERDIVLVAAAGNDGPRAAPLYPGAYDDVIAVTAVDRRKNPYRRAGTGAHIDIAAPGVQVWTAASVEGARSKTGTSFAAPFVTASVAMIKAARPEMKAAEIEGLLRNTAEDLGKPGKDPVFGWGLLNPQAICSS
jgi:subtilisin family serine protease